MKVNYRVWKQYPLSLESHWPEPKQWRDEEGKSWPCWPIGSEAQMSWEVRCRDCGKWAHWIGVGSPFGDGEQYFLGADSFCYWCRPRTTFSAEELRIVSREDWARKETVEELIRIILKGYENRSSRNLPKRLQKLVSDIREATETSEDRLAMYAMLTPSRGSTGVTSE
jgi:hypothetical protein